VWRVKKLGGRGQEVAFFKQSTASVWQKRLPLLKTLILLLDFWKKCVFSPNFVLLEEIFLTRRIFQHAKICLSLSPPSSPTMTALVQIEVISRLDLAWSCATYVPPICGMCLICGCVSQPQSVCVMRSCSSIYKSQVSGEQICLLTVSFTVFVFFHVCWIHLSYAAETVSWDVAVLVLRLVAFCECLKAGRYSVLYCACISVVVSTTLAQHFCLLDHCMPYCSLFNKSFHLYGCHHLWRPT